MTAWSPAATPKRVWPSVMKTDLAAMEMSHSRAATKPAPTAGPLIEEMVGLPQLMRLYTKSLASFQVLAKVR